MQRICKEFVRVPVNTDLIVSLRRQGNPDNAAGVVGGIISAKDDLTAGLRVAVKKSRVLNISWFSRNTLKKVQRPVTVQWVGYWFEMAISLKQYRNHTML